ncbi:uncharacterized protein SAPINGB_P000157 [Magnusiomyces paraingens]|uniref:Ketoreductase domain-containing protein n=1 Tax=Magnusiomyces paraingens TaxID=2606893 RepID=A0A5E8B4J7_9ASCO|nr:uncharacterized protein SAPINGB_P000157 [Saprochaete ingens]VVT43810.1 unnamed protein product [Saprochaete ingens]
MSHPVIIVTGASRGIGAAVVETLLTSKEAPRVVGVSRTEAGLKAIEEKYPGRFVYVTGDVADEATSDAVVRKAIDTFGHIHGIVFNAGVLEPVAQVANADISKWRQLYEINLFAPLTLASKAIPYLRTTFGRLIFVSSGASKSNYSGWAAYGSSKAALNHLAASIAAEENSLFTVAIAPGVVDTRMQDDIRSKFANGMSSQQLERFTNLKKNGELLHPGVPGEILANLALRGQGDDLNGKYLRYNDAALDGYKN